MGAKPCPGELNWLLAYKATNWQMEPMEMRVRPSPPVVVVGQQATLALPHSPPTVRGKQSQIQAHAEQRGYEMNKDLLSARGEQLPPRRGPRRPVPTLVDSPLQQALVCSTEHEPGVEDGSSVGSSVGGWTFGGPT